MTSPRVIWHDAIIPTQNTPGVTGSRIVTEATGATQLSTGIVTFAPGATNATHFHNAEESVIVIEGKGTLVLQGQEHQLKPYDGALITPGTHHRFINTGDVPFVVSWAYATINVTSTPV